MSTHQPGVRRDGYRRRSPDVVEVDRMAAEPEFGGDAWKDLIEIEALAASEGGGAGASDIRPAD